MNVAFDLTLRYCFSNSMQQLGCRKKGLNKPFFVLQHCKRLYLSQCSSTTVPKCVHPRKSTLSEHFGSVKVSLICLH